MAIASSELIINDDGSVFHLHLKPEEISRKILLVGDPGRVAAVAAFLDKGSIEFRRASREFVSLTGKYHGDRITVLSTGIGCDNIDIVMNELDALANIDFATREIKKEKTSLEILRLGTSGAIQPGIPIGSYVFSHYSVGCDGLLNWYAAREEITDVELEEEFMKQVGWSRHLPTPYFAKASEEIERRFSSGVIKGCTVSAGGFYGPQGRVLRMPLAIENMLEKFEAFSYKGLKITNFEMEGSAIAGISGHLGHKAGTICAIIASRYAGTSNPDYKENMVGDFIKFVLDRYCDVI